MSVLGRCGDGVLSGWKLISGCSDGARTSALPPSATGGRADRPHIRGRTQWTLNRREMLGSTFHGTVNAIGRRLVKPGHRVVVYGTVNDYTAAGFEALDTEAVTPVRGVADIGT